MYKRFKLYDEETKLLLYFSIYKIKVGNKVTVNFFLCIISVFLYQVIMISVLLMCYTVLSQVMLFFPRMVTSCFLFLKYYLRDYYFPRMVTVVPFLLKYQPKYYYFSPQMITSCSLPSWQEVDWEAVRNKEVPPPLTLTPKEIPEPREQQCSLM